MINRIFDGKIYTLVEVYNFEEKIIYHYMSEDDEKFFYYDNEKMVLILDEDFIDRIKEEYGLKPIQVLFDVFSSVFGGLKMAKNCHRISLQEQADKIEFFLSYIKKLNLPNVNIDNLRRRLNQIKMYDGEVIEKNISGFYHVLFDCIVVPMDEEHKNVLIHEMIHGCGGAGFGINTSKGFIEGMTESLTSYLWNNGEHSFISNDIHYNMDECTYTEEVCLIRQMEELLGKKSFESILLGKSDFIQEFASKYGMDLKIYLGHRMTRMIDIEHKSPDKLADYFEETQNTLLKVVFNKEIKNVKNIEDAMNYLKRLGDFELVRGRVKGSNAFEEFYNKKFDEVKSMLIELGFNKEEIDSKLSDYKYSRRQFKVFRFDEKELGKQTVFDMMRNIAGVIVENHLLEELDVTRLRVFQGGDEIEGVVLVTYDDQPLYISTSSYNQNNIISDSVKVQSMLRDENGKKIIKFNKDYELKEISIDMEPKLLDREIRKNTEFRKKVVLQELITSEHLLDVSMMELGNKKRKLEAIKLYIDEHYKKYNDNLRMRGFGFKVVFDGNGIYLDDLLPDERDVLSWLWPDGRFDFDERKSYRDNMNAANQLLVDVQREMLKQREKSVDRMMMGM